MSFVLLKTVLLADNRKGAMWSVGGVAQSVISPRAHSDPNTKYRCH
jgi:hypothetical protein